MRISRFLLATFISIPILSATHGVSAQSGPSGFDRSRTYDVKHYRIELKVTPGRRSVEAVTTVTLAPLNDGLAAVVLDSVRLNFSSVTDSDGRQLRYSVAGGRVSVKPAKPLNKGVDTNLVFRYSATPSKGIYFVPAREINGVKRGPQVWTQGEPEEARHWFPSYDFPDDKATSEQILTVPGGHNVIANGKLVSLTDNGDGTETHHFKMDVPHSTYLVSFVIGRYFRWERRLRDIALGFNVYPDRPEMGRVVFERTGDMISVFEDLTKIPYPYNKYDQTVVADFTFGGMENITATTLSDRDVAMGDTPLGRPLVEDLVAHEIAHSWFGNLVTCKNWAELWLNEGFATFMEAAFRERVYGREAYLDKIRQDAAEYFFDDARRPQRHGLYNRLAKGDDSIFNPIVYKKGGAVIHTLRMTVGEEAFWKSVRLYLNRHRFGNATSDDLRRAFEEGSGKDLGWFFKQWVYGIGHPEMTIAASYARSAKALRITVSQTHRAGGRTPATFQMPLEIVVKTAGGSRRLILELTNPLATFTFPETELPTELVVDPDLKIPIKVVKSTKLVLN